MSTAFKIFPATITPDQNKVPLMNNWQSLATNDRLQIDQWMAFYKEKIRYWAVPCGTVNDILVLDVDVKGTNGWDSLRSRGLYLPETMTQKTLSGGSHFIFKYPKDGKTYGNKIGMFPGVDVRGEGGYIFYYGVDSKPIVEAPQWLLENTVKLIQEAQGPSIKIAPEIAKGIVEAGIEAIKQAPPGESNNVLNIEAFRFGQLVASGSIPREYAEQMLYNAAIERGKPPYEARATIKSGLDGGLVKPMTSPFGEPVAAFPIPPPPAPAGRWTPGFLTREDLLNTSKLKKPQIFEDWSSEDITITTADGGTGKTTMKLYEAVCLALGERFLGFNPKQKGKTLFITGEDTDKKLAAMLGAIVRQMGLFEPGPGNNEKIQMILDSIIIKKDSELCIIQKDKASGFLSMNSQALRQVLEAVQDINPKMVVFDPISSFWGSEAALNDMNKAVIKFMSAIVDNTHACVEMINHMGKSSSNTKDMTQFAGRGGTGLPSNARISRTLRSILEDEYFEMTGEYLNDRQTAMLCNVNKYTDGSPLYNKPFLIVREGYLFTRKILTPQKAKEAEQKLTDMERIMSFIKEERAQNKYPTAGIIEGHFMDGGDTMPKSRIVRAIKMLAYEGLMGEKIRRIENPDMTTKDKAFVVIDSEGKEI